MSVESDLQIQSIDMLIDRNPTIVTINRSVFSASSGGRTETESTVGPISLALYNNVVRTAPKASDISRDAVKYDKVEWSAIAKKDADIRAGANVIDTFEVANVGTFRVHTIVDITTDTTITGKLILLEMLT